MKQKYTNYFLSFPKLEDALLEDALHLLRKSLLSDHPHHLDSFPVDLSCQKSNHWAGGAKVVQKMKELEFLGASGHVTLDSKGQRRDIHCDIRQLTQAGQLRLVGTWNTRERLLWRGVHSQSQEDNLQDNPRIRTELGEYLRKRDKSLVVSMVLVRIV